MKLSSIRINGAAIGEGVWIDDVPQLPGAALKVRADRNPDYRRLEAKLVREIPRDRRLDGVDPVDEDRIRAECLARTVLVDWRGIENDAGEAMECSETQRVALMSDPDYLVLLRGVEFAATLALVRRQEDGAADAGN